MKEERKEKGEERREAKAKSQSKTGRAFLTALIEGFSSYAHSFQAEAMPRSISFQYQNSTAGYS